MKQALFRLAAGFLFISMIDPSLADIAPEPQYGQSLTPRRETSIEMPEETVRIHISAEKAAVSAVFVLRNTGAAEKLEVGFPDVAFPPGGEKVQPDARIEGKLRDFKASVDGVPVAPRSQRCMGADSPELIAALEEVERLLETETDPTKRKALEDRRNTCISLKSQWSYLGWLVWNMELAAGQECRVEVSYWVPNRPHAIPSLMDSMIFEYILRTGKAWKGPIGRALIKATIDDSVAIERLGKVSPAGYVLEGRDITWDLKDFEPEQDVTIEIDRFKDLAEAAVFYRGEYAAKNKAGHAEWGIRDLAAAAEAEELAGMYDACAEACVKIIAYEKVARESRPKNVSQGVLRFFKIPYEPWECRLARCLVKLGRKQEAAEAAGAAVVAIEALLAGKKPPSVRLDKPRLQELLESCRAIAEGGR